ncbi:DUF554 domain-containing protein [Nigerium massiliense]|uniref:DUF554 domain-containing protein n=1 Tax=Nigerium massiliense TaxID=1522317 RepID=UPI00058B76C1|nr:DUF554 domain-containing protein [Nigerium massiliense]
MFIGLGTVTNVVTVAAGALLGVLLGNRIPQHARDIVTDVLGLITVVLGFGSAAAMGTEALRAEVGGAGMLIVLGSLLVGAILGTALRLEQRIEGLAEFVQRRFVSGGQDARFVDAVVTPTLLFCVGPLTILGSLSDGLGRGADQLLVKSVMDGFAAIAFASSLGIGVLFSAVAVGIIQGALTLLGFVLGDFLSAAQIDALTATGGVMLLGLALRLLNLKQIAVGNLLPALLLAPLATWGVAALL